MVYRLLLLVSLCPFMTAGTYSGGLGTAENPFHISDLDDWQSLISTPDDWDDHFILTTDLDLAGQTYTQAPIAPDINAANSFFQGISFAGSFNGRGHTIHNLTIQSTGDFIGLFGQIAPTGKVMNLNLRNIQVQGRGKVAGIVGGSMVGYSQEL